MTQKEKVEAYDKALEMAKKELQVCGSTDCDAAKQIFRLFPELKESENEKIRKEIINIFHSLADGKIPVPINFADIFTWLEKQGEPELSEDLGEYIAELSKQFPEVSFAKLSRIAVRIKNWLEKQRQNPAEWHREDEQNLNACLGYIPDEFLRKWLRDIIHVKYDKPADMIEPKFKIGDWVVSSVLGTAHIIDVNDSNEYQLEYIDDKQKFSSIDYVNYEYNEWTIQDAKDGDVLVNGSNIFIFHFINDTRLMGYCHVNTDDGRFYDDIGKNECFCLIDAVVNPATKEQRDLLFQKMNEAGYEWNAEKKELKKIKYRVCDEDKAEMDYCFTKMMNGEKVSEDDEEYNGEDYGIDSLYHAQRILEKTLGKVEGYQTDDGILSHQCAITAVKKLYKQKPGEWSEEDEKMIGRIRNIVEKYAFSQSAVDVNGDLCEKEYIDVDNWLKSLKERIKL